MILPEDSSSNKQKLLYGVVWGKDEYLLHSCLGSGGSSHRVRLPDYGRVSVNGIKEVRASTIDFSFESLAVKVEEARTNADVIKFIGLVGGI